MVKMTMSLPKEKPQELIRNMVASFKPRRQQLGNKRRKGSGHKTTKVPFKFATKNEPQPVGITDENRINNSAATPTPKSTPRESILSSKRKNREKKIRESISKLESSSEDDQSTDQNQNNPFTSTEADTSDDTFSNSEEKKRNIALDMSGPVVEDESMFETEAKKSAKKSTRIQYSEGTDEMELDHIIVRDKIARTPIGSPKRLETYKSSKKSSTKKSSTKKSAKKSDDMMQVIQVRDKIPKTPVYVSSSPAADTFQAQAAETPKSGPRKSTTTASSSKKKNTSPKESNDTSSSCQLKTPATDRRKSTTRVSSASKKSLSKETLFNTPGSSSRKSKSPVMDEEQVDLAMESMITSARRASMAKKKKVVVDGYEMLMEDEEDEEEPEDEAVEESSEPVQIQMETAQDQGDIPQFDIDDMAGEQEQPVIEDESVHSEEQQSDTDTAEDSVETSPKEAKQSKKKKKLVRDKLQAAKSSGNRKSLGKRTIHGVIPDESAQTPGCRRSKRTKWKPLEFWKGERLIVELDAAAAVETGNSLADAIKIKAGRDVLFQEDDDLTMAAPKKRRKSRKNLSNKFEKEHQAICKAKSNKENFRKRLPKGFKETSSDVLFEYIHHVTKKKLQHAIVKRASEVALQPLGTLPYDAPKGAKVQTPPKELSKPEEMSEFLTATCAFATDDFRCGTLCLPPLKKKPMELTKDCFHVFAIRECVDQALCVTIDGNHFLCSPGDQFFVPANTKYALCNYSAKSDSLLTYTVV